MRNKPIYKIFGGNGKPDGENVPTSRQAQRRLHKFAKREAQRFTLPPDANPDGEAKKEREAP